MKRPVILGGGVALTLAALPSAAFAEVSEAEFRALAERLQVVESELEQYKVAAVESRKAELDAEANKKVGMKYKWGPSPTFQSDDGQFALHVHGRVVTDFGHISDSNDRQDRNATTFRDVRLGADGTAWGDFKYKLQIDFSQNQVDIKDAFVQYVGWDPITISVGNYWTTNVLDKWSSSLQVSLVEPAGFSEAFNIQRRLGAWATYQGSVFRVDAGIYGAALRIPDVQADNEGYAVSARAVYFPKLGDDIQLHFGTSVLYRSYSANSGLDNNQTRLRVRPQSSLSAFRYIDTGSLNAKNDLFIGAEAAAVWGPVWIESEWAWDKVKKITGKLDDQGSFQGGYFGVGWFITGESRGYKPGEWDRTKVLNPVGKNGGTGAIALVGRVDYVDLNDVDAGIFGGKQLMLIGGVNWHLNDNMVVKVNYAHADVKDALGNKAATNALGKAKIDSITARFQLDW